MLKEKFRLRFVSASDECVKLSRGIISNKLPTNRLYNLYINLYKNNNRVEKFLRLNLDEAVEKLYRDGAIPKWVDVNVAKVDDGYLIIQCIYSDNFIKDDMQLQFHDQPTSPFKSGGPGFYTLDKLDKIKRGEKVILDEFDEEKG